MKTFFITITGTFTKTIMVKADSEQEAAQKCFAGGAGQIIRIEEQNHDVQIEEKDTITPCDDVQHAILEASIEATRSILSRYGGLDTTTEDGVLRPHLLRALESRGFRTQQNPVWLPTSVRQHPFDLTWERDGIRGAIELKLKSQAQRAPVDDSRLFFWYDLKWLEAGIEVGSLECGTAILLTDIRQLYEETGRGDWRHSYYQIGHLNPHRCRVDGPDHFFGRKYKPETQFLPQLYPLKIQGCYDFRDKWHVINDELAHDKSVFLLVVPVPA
jgi:hypothetical protein